MTAQVPDDIGGRRGDALCPDTVASARASENVNRISLGDPGAVGTENSSLSLCPASAWSLVLGRVSRSWILLPAGVGPLAVGCPTDPSAPAVGPSDQAPPNGPGPQGEASGFLFSLLLLGMKKLGDRDLLCYKRGFLVIRLATVIMHST